MNAGAQTIHSFFHFPSLFLDAKNLPEGRKFGVLYHRMTRLVIDEISMVRADLLDAMDARLRKIRNDDRPFGGVQVIMVGDFLQLPPVVEQEHRPLLHALGYKSPFAFSAHVLQSVSVSVVSLEQVHRQEEQEFIKLLGRIRIGENTNEVANILNEKCHGQHRVGITPLLLTPTRAAADRYNRAGLAALPREPIFFHAEIFGKLEIDKDRLPVPEHLELRVGDA
jgi:ATP-dependent DNA helicase PIF1